LLTELSRLIEVQEIDMVIREVTQGLERLPEELRAVEAALEELKAAHAVLLQDLEGLKAQRRDTETEMADMEEGIKTSRQRLMEIKSNIEYKAMLKEIAFKEDQRDQRETRILEFMDLMETQSRLITEQKQLIDEQEEALTQQRQEVAAQVATLQQELGTAIAPVHEGVCLGCHMNILPQQFIDLQKGLEILQCPHCQRILFWADELGDEAATEQQVS
jgi:uncharacterized protein